ncbi:acyl transferase [Nocardia sp. NBC_00403]|uniref:acyl transferase n=1 Tax=Nocardia sp. NBC_00403 TaxID=2975990 RepID=UPI002E21B554
MPTSPESPAPQPTTSASASTQPNSSSFPPSGTPFGGEGLGAQQITDLQKAVDSGHQPWRLDRIQVAKTFVQSRFSWTSVQTSGGAPTIVFVTNSDGGKVALNLSQPATQGAQGIWVVQSGMWSREG